MYGPWQRPDHDYAAVIPKWIWLAMNGGVIEVYGDGSQTRSFCYVDDLIEGLVSLFFTESVHEPVNLGNPAPINMLELAKEIINLTGSASSIAFKDLPSDDPKIRMPDISEAKKRLGWTPSVSRIDGLKRTIEYFSGV